MALKCGIVGLPNVGKSTLFNCLSGAKAQAANFPFCTIEPNVGVITVPDERLNRLAELVHPGRIVPATCEIVDIAGLVKGASKGEGLGNKFLGNIRETDAIIHVLRCFEDDNITHVDGTIDPIRDKEIIDTELQLKDLETIESRLAKTEKAAAKTEEDIAELESYDDKQLFLEELGLEESGVIHTDFEKGFIRAEVIKYDDYIQYGSEAAVREAGRLASRARTTSFRTTTSCTSALMYRLPLLISLMLALSLRVDAGCRQLSLRVERLADLNIPRMGHQVFSAGGEVVVAGGHTTGFVPTATAEYYRDGQWHVMPMTYTHDQGGMMVTSAGEVLLFGGHKQELGIDQTFTLERYDPATHSFRGYGCLEEKRCFASAQPVDSGNIIISGNWYHDDCIEVYDGSRQCKFVKPVAQHRSQPHIIRTAKDNAIVFGSHDIHANDFDTIIVDRLKGEPFTVSLFETWRPICQLAGSRGSCFIGDERRGDYTSLLQVMRGDTLMAIARVTGEDFSLLPTTTPIPMRSQWSRICWYAPIVADRSRGRAYIVGYGENYPDDTGDHRFYVAVIDYRSTPAPITLFYSEPQDGAGR